MRRWRLTWDKAGLPPVGPGDGEHAADVDPLSARHVTGDPPPPYPPVFPHPLARRLLAQPLLVGVLVGVVTVLDQQTQHVLILRMREGHAGDEVVRFRCVAVHFRPHDLVGNRAW